MQTPHRLTLAASLLGLSILSPVHAALDDTGITTCSNATQNGLTCPQAGFPRQDAEYGTNKFNFTKLDANGRALASTATAWSCVQDNITGLVWEEKTSDGGLRDKNWNYTWYNSNSTDGNLGTPSGGTCKTTGRCDTEKFVQDVNATSLCGHNDWRLPNPHELASIVDYSIPYSGPTIDTGYFPNTLANSGFWTSAANADGSSFSWIVYFNYGLVSNNFRSSSYAVRLVRGGQSFGSLALQDHNDGTISDTTTGLLWAKCSQGQSGSTCSGTPSTMDWGTALTTAATANLAGYTDWRLPSAKELQSIVDYSRSNPSVNTTYFPTTSNTWYWTSSAYAYGSSYSWIVVFDSGLVNNHLRGNRSAVRLVRGGQSFGFLALTISRLGTGSGVVVSDPAGINCPALCSSANFYPTTSVVLAAIPATGSVFAGWGGDCATTGTVTMNANKTCTATFNPALAVPSVITGTPSVITATSATLTGTVTPNGAVTTTSFEFGPTTNYGTTITATPASIAIGAAATAISATRTGLNCYTLYHYRAKAVNSVGTSYGADKSFTTGACAPLAITTAVTNLTDTVATLNGKVTPNGAATTVTFDFGFASGSYNFSLAATPSSISATAGATTVTTSVTGLTCHTPYYYRIKAVNSFGTVYSTGASFTTIMCPLLPSATTTAATNLAYNAATLNASVASNGAATTVSFDYGPTTSYGSTITATPASLLATVANTPVAVTANLTNLTCNSTYHYRVKAVNSLGTTYGSDLNLKTLPCPVDLTLTLSNGRTSIGAGDTLTYTAVVSNAGPFAANNALFKAPAVTNLSITNLTCGTLIGTTTCPTSLTTATLQGTGLVIPTLPASGGLTFTLTATVLASTVSSYNLTYTATATAPTGTADTNLANNSASMQNRVVGRPDFLITSIMLSPTTGPIAGAAFNAIVTVKNQGTVAGNGGFLDVWTNQTTAPACGSMGNNQATVGTLAMGESKTLTLPGLSSGTAGSKTFRAFVDSSCATPESNEANNQATLSYTVAASAAKPDFIITALSITPTSPTATSTFSATVTVKNQGTVAANAAYLDLWANQTTAPTCGASGDTWVDVSSLAAGASLTYTRSGLHAGSAGTKTLRAFVDSWCEVAESNEGNNQATLGYTVQ